MQVLKRVLAGMFSVLLLVAAMSVCAEAKFKAGGHRHKVLAQTMYGMLGTPYRFGGASQRGADCSGFVRVVYVEVGYDLPHSAEALRRVGYEVEGPLTLGDIIVFKGRHWHVGIYVGHGQFIHASSTRGCVVIADLAEYHNRVVAIRRLP